MEKFKESLRTTIKEVVRETVDARLKTEGEQLKVRVEQLETTREPTAYFQRATLLKRSQERE